MNYYELREKYKTFVYSGYTVSEDSNELNIEYHFKIDGLSEFAPIWKFKKNSNVMLKNDRIINKIIFSLGMTELVSYWKIACPQNVIVECGDIDNRQAEWWKKLYFNGLGEFFYINNITPSFDDFMTISSNHIVNNTYTDEYLPTLKGSLIPIGGGKDSDVTLALLKDSVKDNVCYMINNRPSSKKAMETANFTEEQQICAYRTLDKNMLQLNKEGFLNGHTPFSSIVAFSSLLQAYILGKKYIVLSNESSANESTVADSAVNHQYSKSYEFEQDFIYYVKNFIGCGVEYFSFLRPLEEIQIAHIFSKYPQFHNIFRSCNKGSKKDLWCCDCAKCLFVYIILSPFLSTQKMTDIFSENLLDKESLKSTFEQLIGIQKDKPFECVGSQSEAKVALNTLYKRLNKDNEKLPKLLDYYISYFNIDINTAKTYNINEYYDTKNSLPKEFDEILKKEIKVISLNEQ